MTSIFEALGVLIRVGVEFLVKVLERPSRALRLPLDGPGDVFDDAE